MPLPPYILIRQVFHLNTYTELDFVAVSDEGFVAQSEGLTEVLMLTRLLLVTKICSRQFDNTETGISSSLLKGN